MIQNLKSYRMNIQKKIELYIEGQMNKEQIDEFEGLLQNDSILANEVAQKKKLHDLLSKKLKYESPTLLNIPNTDINRIQELSIDDDLDQFFYNYEGEISKEEKELISFLRNKRSGNDESKNKKNRLFLGIAASLVLLLTLSIGLKKLVTFKMNNNISQAIFKEYYQPETDPNILEIIPQNYKFKKNILINNNSGKKAELKINFEALRSGEKSEEELINISIVLIQDRKYQLASSNFESLLNCENEKISTMAKWYYTLLQIKLKNPEIAIEYLEMIENSNSGYADKAREIYKKLKGQ